MFKPRTFQQLVHVSGYLYLILYERMYYQKVDSCLSQKQSSEVKTNRPKQNLEYDPPILVSISITVIPPP